jgi:hypothetical protein
MTEPEMMPVQRDEIAQIAYYSWLQDGRPPGRDLDYWLEAEQQLKATKHLLLAEAGVGGKNGPSRNPGKARTARGGARHCP